MKDRVPTRARVEQWLAFTAAALAVVTLVWRDWLEIVFRIDPDHGDGSAEWMIVGGLLALSALLTALSRLEIRRAARSPAP